MSAMKTRIVSDEVAYEGRIVRVHKVGIQGPGGKVVPRDLLEFSDATVIIPVLDDGSVVIIRNERFAVGEELLEFPAGKVEPGEQPEACAARELTEETGYTAGQLEKLGGFYSAPGALTEYLHVFLATGLAPGPQQLEGYENITVTTVHPDQLAELMRSGQLHDAKSIAAWALWRLRKGQ
jgi:ADP-ribose pyrophosphatase